MSKNIKFQYEGKLYDINVERNGNVLTIEHEGSNFVVSMASPVGGAAPVAAPVAPAAPAPVAAPVAPAAPAPVAAPVAPAPVAAPAVSAAGAATEKAAITGTIKEIKVAQGTAVKSGDLLVIMEAMKMDIEVFATHAGTVSAIHVTPGSNVTEGQPLVDIS